MGLIQPNPLINKLNQVRFKEKKNFNPSQLTEPLVGGKFRYDSLCTLSFKNVRGKIYSDIFSHILYVIKLECNYVKIKEAKFYYN